MIGLSPGTYHERVPRGVRENLLYRRRVLASCRSSARNRAAVREMCRRDFLFFVCVFVWQYNPAKLGKEVGPFVPWPFQDEAARAVLAAIADQKDLVIEKSREMGASWLCLLVIVWVWLFHPRKKILVISRDEKAVDNDKDADSLFWKVDFVLANLPGFLMPQGWDQKKHRQRLSFNNPETKSQITGAASTGKSGVGGRATFIFLDEFSQVREDYEMLHRTSNTAGCRIFNGTHLGMGTAFYELTRRENIRKLRMHWTQHPDKVAGLYRYNPITKTTEVLDAGYHFPPGYRFVQDGTPTGGYAPGVRSVYYDDECERKGSAQAVAMDLDIDAGGTISQFYDAILIRHLQGAYCRPPAWRGDVGVSDDGKVIEWAEGDRGKLLLWRPLGIDGTPVWGRYAAGADVSEGKGATPSCLTILDADTGEKVLEYADAAIDPRVFGRLCVALCRAFRQPDGTGALFAWEAQGPGEDLRAEVESLGYFRIYFRTNEFALNKKVSDTPGWYPSPANKRKVHGDYRNALRTRQFSNPSERALEEALLFEELPQDVDCPSSPSRGDPSGATVTHGDRVVADALAWMMKLKIAAPPRPGRERVADPVAPDHRSVAGRRALAERLAAAADA
jgi:hypothetical protein